MHYFSTGRKSPNVGFRDAVLIGQPEDRGLYFPSVIPKLGPGVVESLRDRPNADIAFNVIKPFVANEIPDEKLFEICFETVENFDFPLVEITDRISALELFHGPTLAFKDIGARFMSRCLRYFMRDRTRKTLVVVATSGDTGGAVASGFSGIDGVEVVILFPKGKVSRVQELQLTTAGGNVTALEVRGDFDACQKLVKSALADPHLRSKAHLTSANSINIARWLPQQFYYFFAMRQWGRDAPVISVPSGNFGNLAAGVLAFQTGLPVKRFVAACNKNDIVPRFMRSASMDVRPTIETLSNAMDVGNPSNFVRIMEMLGTDPAGISRMIEAVSITDHQTSITIKDVYERDGYILDPHGAVAFRALEDFLAADPRGDGIFLETAHPIKFDSVGSLLGDVVPQPDSLRDLGMGPASKIEIAIDYRVVKDLLISRI